MAKSVLDTHDFSASGQLILPSVALDAEGKVRWDPTNDRAEVHDGQRARIVGAQGWQPYAYPIGSGPTATATTSQTLAANGGTIAMPFAIDGHMLLESLTIRNLDTSLAHTAEWAVYVERLNNGNAGENTLDAITAIGTFSWTPAAAANVTSAALSPTYIGPGLVWVVLRNNSPSNRTLLLGSQAAGTMAQNICQTKTLASGLASTLDFVAATWTKQTFLPGMRLNGRVFGQTAVF